MPRALIIAIRALIIGIRALIIGIRGAQRRRRRAAVGRLVHDVNASDMDLRKRADSRACALCPAEVPSADPSDGRAGSRAKAEHRGTFAGAQGDVAGASGDRGGWAIGGHLEILNEAANDTLNPTSGWGCSFWSLLRGLREHRLEGCLRHKEATTSSSVWRNRIRAEPAGTAAEHAKPHAPTSACTVPAERAAWTRGEAHLQLSDDARAQCGHVLVDGESWWKGLTVAYHDILRRAKWRCAEVLASRRGWERGEGALLAGVSRVGFPRRIGA